MSNPVTVNGASETRRSLEAAGYTFQGLCMGPYNTTGERSKRNGFFYDADGNRVAFMLGGRFLRIEDDYRQAVIQALIHTPIRATA